MDGFLPDDVVSLILGEVFRIGESRLLVLLVINRASRYTRQILRRHAILTFKASPFFAPPYREKLSDYPIFVTFGYDFYQQGKPTINIPEERGLYLPLVERVGYRDHVATPFVTSDCVMKWFYVRTRSSSLHEFSSWNEDRLRNTIKSLDVYSSRSLLRLSLQWSGKLRLVPTPGRRQIA